MIVKCPNCHKPVIVNGLGRKRENVTVTFVCNALQAGSGSYQRAAEIISEDIGKKVTRGFVYQRIRRAGLTKEDIIRGNIL